MQNTRKRIRDVEMISFLRYFLIVMAGILFGIFAYYLFNNSVFAGLLASSVISCFATEITRSEDD